MRYFFEVTKFHPKLSVEKTDYESIETALSYIDTFDDTSSVVYVAAIKGNVDYGNFYLFINEKGSSHIMLHEHHEHYAIETDVIPTNSNQFLHEDGDVFIVDDNQVTTFERGILALKYWIPNQGKWSELDWI